MADPRGFLKAGRELPTRRPVDVRIQDWREVLPTQSVCLTVPVMRPSEHDHFVMYRQQRDARALRQKEKKVETANPGQH